MKKQVLFIHEAGGRPESSGLLTHLKDALGADYEVIAPAMPEPENPRYAPWQEQVAKELAGLGGEVILVGHSLGGSVLVKYLSEHDYKQPVAGLFLVASAYWGGKDPDWQVEEYALHADFASKLPHGMPVFLYHSSGDEVVSFSHQAEYAEKLPQAIVHELSGSEHYFEDGLPELAEDIKSL
jgi:predicted alpha/beta hydrolase family esterase